MEVGCATGPLDGLARGGGGQQGAKVGSLGQDLSFLSTIKCVRRFFSLYSRCDVKGSWWRGAVEEERWW